MANNFVSNKTENTLRNFGSFLKAKSGICRLQEMTETKAKQACINIFGFSKDSYCFNVENASNKEIHIKASNNLEYDIKPGETINIVFDINDNNAFITLNTSCKINGRIYNYDAENWLSPYNFYLIENGLNIYPDYKLVINDIDQIYTGVVYLCTDDSVNIMFSKCSYEILSKEQTSDINVSLSDLIVYKIYNFTDNYFSIMYTAAIGGPIVNEYYLTYFFDVHNIITKLSQNTLYTVDITNASTNWFRIWKTTKS